MFCKGQLSPVYWTLWKWHSLRFVFGKGQYTIIVTSVYWAIWKWPPVDGSLLGAHDNCVCAMMYDLCQGASLNARRFQINLSLLWQYLCVMVSEHILILSHSNTPVCWDAWWLFILLHSANLSMPRPGYWKQLLSGLWIRFINWLLGLQIYIYIYLCLYIFVYTNRPIRVWDA